MSINQALRTLSQDKGISSGSGVRHGIRRKAGFLYFDSGILGGSTIAVCNRVIEIYGT